MLLFTHEKFLSRHICKDFRAKKIYYKRHEDSINRGIADICVHINQTECWIETKLLRSENPRPSTNLMSLLRIKKWQRDFLVEKQQVKCYTGIIYSGHEDNIFLIPNRYVRLLPSLSAKHLSKIIIKLGYPFDYYKLLEEVKNPA